YTTAKRPSRRTCAWAARAQRPPRTTAAPSHGDEPPERAVVAGVDRGRRLAPPALGELLLSLFARGFGGLLRVRLFGGFLLGGLRSRFFGGRGGALLAPSLAENAVPILAELRARTGTDNRTRHAKGSLSFCDSRPRMTGL